LELEKENRYTDPNTTLVYVQYYSECVQIVRIHRDFSKLKLCNFLNIN